MKIILLLIFVVLLSVSAAENENENQYAMTMQLFTGQGFLLEKIAATMTDIAKLTQFIEDQNKAMKTQNEAMQAKMDNLQTKMDNSQAQNEAMQAKMDKLQTQNEAMQVEMERLQAQIHESSEITTNHHSVFMSLTLVSINIDVARGTLHSFNHFVLMLFDIFFFFHHFEPCSPRSE